MRDPQAQDAHAAALEGATERATGNATPLVVTPAGDDEPILVLHPDGRLEIREGAESEAARLFVEDVYRMWRSALPEPELRLADALALVRSRLVVLEQERDEALYSLRHIEVIAREVRGDSLINPEALDADALAGLASKPIHPDDAALAVSVADIPQEDTTT